VSINVENFEGRLVVARAAGAAHFEIAIVMAIGVVVEAFL
jgi:hypothetical protein